MITSSFDADLATNDTSVSEVSSERLLINPFSGQPADSIPALRQRFRADRIQTDQDRIREYNSIPEHVGSCIRIDPEPSRYPINMHCTEEQFILIQEAFDLLKKQSEGYIKRAENNPSESIKSQLTIERHQAKLSQLDDIVSRFSENAF